MRGNGWQQEATGAMRGNGKQREEREAMGDNGRQQKATGATEAHGRKREEKHFKVILEAMRKQNGRQNKTQTECDQK